MNHLQMKQEINYICRFMTVVHTLPLSPPPIPQDDEYRFKECILFCEWVEDYDPGGYHPVVLGDVFHDDQYKVIRKLGDGCYSTGWLAPLGGSRHITQLLDEFNNSGPNGTHKCLVLEPLSKGHRRGLKIHYPYWMAKGILRQSLQALVFLHENGSAHCDFHPGNMLFMLRDINSKPEDEPRQGEHVEAGFISSPLCIAQPLVYPTDYGQDIKIKLSPMGGASFVKEPPAKPATLAGRRTPEYLLTGAVNHTMDIWSFGCLVFELLTGRQLLCEEPLIQEEPIMKEAFDQVELDTDEEEARRAKALIRRILLYDPEERPSAAEVLRDPWFLEDEVRNDSS
ncbi:serine protein kinase [Xylaria venustula]|nr:serine protein kinase [Xylaria venustula]